MDTITEYNFLEYLKKKKPYLFKIEMEVRRITNATGYGDISINCIIREGKVFSSDVGGWIKELYKS